MSDYYPLEQVTFKFLDKDNNERATGTFNAPVELVQLGWVDRPKHHGLELNFFTAHCKLDTFLFHIKANVEPSWFGVAVPDRVRQFQNVHIFFHPQPAQAKLDDNKYADFTTNPGWVAVFRYANMLGLQLAASTRQQILIMPFLTQRIAARGIGIFNNEWLNIANDIIAQLLRRKHDPLGAAAAEFARTIGAARIASLCVSSFSSGIVYSHHFRSGGANVDNYLREVYDFDGAASDAGALSQSVVSTKGRRGWRYDKLNNTDLGFLDSEAANGRFHLPFPRWPRCHPPPKSPKEDPEQKDVHALIIQRMFWHALAHSQVGA